MLRAQQQCADSSWKAGKLWVGATKTPSCLPDRPAGRGRRPGGTRGRAARQLREEPARRSSRDRTKVLKFAGLLAGQRLWLACLTNCVSPQAFRQLFRPGR